MTESHHDGPLDPSEDDRPAPDGDGTGETDGIHEEPSAGPATAPVSAASGDPTVDAVLSTLDRLDELAVDEHLPVFEEAHRALRQSLDRPAGAPGSED